MYQIITLLLVILFLVFIKRNIYENAYWNIPTRSCEPTRFTVAYDVRGSVPVPVSYQQMGPLLHSEGIGMSTKYCLDTFPKINE